MKIIVVVFVFFISISGVFAQVNNLVPNGNFEFYTGCPSNLSQIDSAFPWTQPNINGSSSDYFNTCNNFWYPNFFVDYPPRSGNGFAGILPSDFYVFIDYREYICNQLKIPLVQNKKYCAKFFVIRGKTNIIIDAFGIYFSNNFVSNASFDPLLYPAQVKNPRGNMLADTAHWMKIAGSFIAHGGEQYITIGNFEPQDSVTRVYLGTDPTSCSYMIDDVSVCNCEDFNISLGNDTTLCAGQQLLLLPNMPKGADSVIYTWQNGSHGKTFTVNQAGTYNVSAYIQDYNISVSASIRVNYQNCDTIAIPTTPPLWLPNSFTPNGDGLNDKFEYANAENYIIKTYIYNRWGQMVFEGENSNFWDGTFNGKTVQLGVYAYKIEAMDRIGKIQKIYSGRITVVN